MSLLRIITGFGSLFAFLVAFIFNTVQFGKNYTLGALIAGAVLLFTYIIFNIKLIFKFFTLKSTRYGVNIGFVTLIVLGIILILNVISMRHNKAFDTTKNKRYSLSPQTIKILKNLKKEVTILGSFIPDERDWQIRSEDLIDQYKRYSTKLKYVHIDAEKNPALVEQYNIPKPAISPLIYVSGNDRIEKSNGFKEQDITNAIISVTREKSNTVYFAAGDGEKNTDAMDQEGLTAAVEALKKERYTVEKINIIEWRYIPEDCSVLIILGPTKSLWNIELKAITDYIMKGGKVFFMLDPEQSSELVDYLSQFGIKVGNDMVIEPSLESTIFGGDYLMPFVSRYNEMNEITKGMNLRTIFPRVRSVSKTDKVPDGIEIQELITTSDQSWGETNLTLLKQRSLKLDKEDLKGPVSIASIATVEVDKFKPKPIEVEKNIQSLFTPQKKADESNKPADTITATADTQSTTTAESASKTGEKQPQDTDTKDNKKDDSGIEKLKPKYARIVVFGDSDFATNALFGSKTGNSDLFLNTINWLAEEEDLISIHPKDIEDTSLILTATQLRVLFVLSLFMIPLIVVIIGITVWIRRRRTA